MGKLLSRLLAFSTERRWAVVLATAIVAMVGTYSFLHLPIDAVPDITNVQVQINTPSVALGPNEMERRVTFPIETAMAGIPKVEQVRSISRYGLSQVTVVFEDGTDIYWARQQIAERVAAAKEELPEGVGQPSLGPISTGLGEIYFYAIEAEEGATRADGSPYTLTDLRTLQDWVVKPQMRGVKGITEVNSIGGYEKTFQVSPDPAKLVGFGISFGKLYQALKDGNDTAGGGYIEHKGEQYIVRALGLVRNLDDVRDTVIERHDGIPVRIGDVAEVVEGRDLRTGASTSNGHEAVIGTAIMLLGENSRVVSKRVDERLAEIRKSLPPGVRLTTLYDRSYLVDATLHTVEKSLAEGALLVVLVLFLLLGNFRAALVAALAIPLSMLMAAIGMLATNVSGNLMSLGAIDFGIIVDGAVIVVENSIRCFAHEQARLGRVLTAQERVKLSYSASHEVLRSALFGEVIIAVVYLPILSLSGIEGKMFRPMAATVVLALTGATMLSTTFIPAMVALFVSGRISEKETRLLSVAKRGYGAAIAWAERRTWLVLTGAAAVVVGTGLLATRLGAEFTPRLGEGAFAIETSRIPSIGISTSVAYQKRVERTLLGAFPDEIERVFARTGTAEIANDPMGPDSTDTFVMLKPRDQWKKARTQEELAGEMSKVLDDIPGQATEISQPIELRTNELMSGVKSDLAIKVFGDDMEILLDRAEAIARVVNGIEGASDVRVEKVTGLPVLTIDIDRRAAARYGLSVSEIETVVRAAVGGASAGEVYQGDQRFDLVMRLPDSVRDDPEAIERLPIAIPRDDGSTHPATTFETTEHMGFVPLGAVAKIALEEGPNQVSRESGKRRIVVQCNVRGRDIASFVGEARERVDTQVKMPSGTWLGWGGQFENLIAAKERLLVVVPVALVLIFGLLYLSFGQWKNALLIFTGVPLALSGGIVALAARGLPFSITAAVGFIALSGVAVLNGLVMVSFIEGLRCEGRSIDEAVREGAIARLRPVLMTALVAALGFVPMAIATGMGAEVQRPLATVVIGGILSSTLLTLLVLPTLYRLAHRNEPVASASEDPRSATGSDA